MGSSLQNEPEKASKGQARSAVFAIGYRAARFVSGHRAVKSMIVIDGCDALDLASVSAVTLHSLIVM
jgi:hypothetical protein